MMATRVLQYICQWTFVFMMTLLLFANGLPFYEKNIVQGMVDDPAEQHVVSSRQAGDNSIDLTKLSNGTGGNLTEKASPLNSTLNHTAGRASSHTALLQQNAKKSVIIPQNNASIQAVKPIPTISKTTTNTSGTSTVILVEPKPSKTISNVANVVSTANASISSSGNNTSVLPNITSPTNVTKILSTRNSSTATNAKVKATSPTPLLKANNNITTVVTSASRTKSTPSEPRTAIPKMPASVSAAAAALLSSHIPSVIVTKIAKSVSVKPQSSIASSTAQGEPAINATTVSKPATKPATTSGKLTTKPPTKPTIQKPSSKVPTEPKINQTTSQPLTKPSSEKPSTKPPTEPTTKQPTTKQPTTKQPTTKQPTKPSTLPTTKTSTKPPTIKQTTKQPAKPQTQPPTTKPPTTNMEPKPSTKSPTKPTTKPTTKSPTVKLTTKAKTTEEETTLRPETKPPVKLITTAAKKQNNVQNDVGVKAPSDKGQQAVLWDFIVPVGIGVAVALTVAFGVLMVRTCRRKRLIKVRFGGKPSHPRLLNNDLINLLAESDDEEE